MKPMTVNEPTMLGVTQTTYEYRVSYEYRYGIEPWQYSDSRISDKELAIRVYQDKLNPRYEKPEYRNVKLEQQVIIKTDWITLSPICEHPNSDLIGVQDGNQFYRCNDCGAVNVTRQAE